jgi:hypothetical protein
MRARRDGFNTKRGKWGTSPLVQDGSGEMKNGWRRVQRESVEGGVGCGGGRSRSWAPFIGPGRRAVKE